MPINILYDDLCLDEKKLMSQKESLSQKYDLQLTNDINILDFDKELKKKIFGHTFCISCNNILGSMPNKQCIDGKLIKNYLYDHENFKALYFDILINFFMKIGISNSKPRELSHYIQHEYEEFIPYRIDKYNISSWGKSFQDNVFNKHNKGLFIPIKRNKNRTSFDTQKFERFSLPRMTSVYDSIPIDHLESHILFESSIGYALSYTIFTAFVQILLYKTKYRERKYEDQFNNNILDMLNTMKDIYPIITSIPFPGLRLRVANSFIEHLFESEYFPSYPDRTKETEDSINISHIKNILAESKKNAIELQEFILSDKFSDYYHMHWIKFVEDNALLSLIRNDLSANCQNSITSFLSKKRSELLACIERYHHSQLLPNVADIKENCLYLFCLNSDSIAFNDIKNYPYPINLSIDDYYNDHKKIHRIIHENECSFDDDCWHSCKNIKFNSNRFDFFKIYCLIQSDISHACQLQYANAKIPKISN